MVKAVVVVGPQIISTIITFLFELTAAYVYYTIYFIGFIYKI